MLRLIVLTLLLVNAGYYVWSHRLLREWGITPTEEAESQRMAQQIRPGGLRILRAGMGEALIPAPAPLPTPAPAASPAPAPAIPAAPAALVAPAVPEPVAALVAPAASKPLPTPMVCLQAGVFNAAQADVLRRTMTSNLPVGSWRMDNVTLPGRWMVYMGRFTDNETLNKKRNELRARKVSFDRPGVAALEPGFTLGRFSSEEAADRALIALAKRGVHSARVVQEREETPSFVLRLPAVDANLRAQLHEMRRALAGKTLRPC